MKESELVKEYTAKLLPWWDVYHEIEGRSIISGKLKRIDMIIVSKQIPDGLTKPMVFGVECKRPTLESLNDYTKWLRQSIGYTQCKWGKKCVQLPILVAPSLDRDYCGQEGVNQSFMFKHVAGTFGIGEIVLKNYERDYGNGTECISIEMSGTKVWSNFYGFNKAMAKVDYSKKYTL